MVPARPCFRKSPQQPGQAWGGGLVSGWVDGNYRRHGCECIHLRVSHPGTPADMAGHEWSPGLHGHHSQAFFRVSLTGWDEKQKSRPPTPGHHWPCTTSSGAHETTPCPGSHPLILIQSSYFPDTTEETNQPPTGSDEQSDVPNPVPSSELGRKQWGTGREMGGWGAELHSVTPSQAGTG